MTANYNAELNGIELKFDTKPSETILNLLRSAGYRWHNVKKIWYAKQNERAIKAAEQITQDENGIISDAPIAKKENGYKSLYERLKFTIGTADKSKYNYKYVGSNYTGLTVKDTAVMIRKILKENLPEVKFSVTSDHHSIEINIKASPYDNKHLKYESSRDPAEYRAYDAEHNKEIEAIKDYCSALLESYNYDDSDSMTDYFDVHFYKNIYVDRDYIQTEQTEEIKNDIENFRQALINAECEAEAEKEKEYQKRIEEAEKQREESLKYAKIAAEHKEYILNNVSFTDLTDESQYMIFNSQFARLNKNQRLSDYIEEIQSGEYNNEDIKITREVHFNDVTALNYFNEMFLTDFDFISGTGGSSTDDPRVNSMLDYNHMTEEERQTVKFYRMGIAVYLNNKLQYVIDSQGYNYARYVGLTDESYKGEIPQPKAATDEIKQAAEIALKIENISADVIKNNDIMENWHNNKVYYKAMIEALKTNKIKLNGSIIQQIKDEDLKQQIYILNKWSDEIPVQFEDANIQKDEKITIYHMGGMGGISENRVIFDSFTPCKYAQYDKAVKLICKPEHKHNFYYNYYHNGQNLMIFKGWYQIPESVLWETISDKNGVKMKHSIFGSCDRRQIDKISEYFEQFGIEPIIRDKSSY